MDNFTHNFRSRVAVVTGGSRGIGEAIARALAEAGASVVICGRNREVLDQTVERLQNTTGDVRGIAANVALEDDRAAIIDTTLSWFGRLDILVNNAGANPSYGGLADLTEKALDKVLDVNLKAVLFLSQLAYNTWMKENGGVILNVSSIGGFQCTTGINGYNVVKAALNHLTKCLASEWGPDGVRVNTLAPGIIKTQFSQALWDNPKYQKIMDKNPVPRFGEVEDLAGAALFLASDAAAYITGHTMVIDGGTLVRNS